MNAAFISLGGLPAIGLKKLVLGWLVAEVLCLCLAIKLLGVGGTLLVGLGTTLVGAVILRRLGLEAARQLSRTITTGQRGEAVVDGTLTALGAVLLIVPGFVSDAIGLALATPSVRQRIARRLFAVEAATRRPAGRAGPEVIDLSPEDWRVVDRSHRA